MYSWDNQGLDTVVNHGLKRVFKTQIGFTLRRRGLALGRPPSMKSLLNPRVHVRPCLKLTIFKKPALRVSTVPSTIEFIYLFLIF